MSEDHPRILGSVKRLVDRLAKCRARQKRQNENRKLLGIACVTKNCARSFFVLQDTTRFNFLIQKLASELFPTYPLTFLATVRQAVQSASPLPSIVRRPPKGKFSDFPVVIIVQ